MDEQQDQQTGFIVNGAYVLRSVVEDAILRVVVNGEQPAAVAERFGVRKNAFYFWLAAGGAERRGGPRAGSWQMRESAEVEQEHSQIVDQALAGTSLPEIAQALGRTDEYIAAVLHFCGYVYLPAAHGQGAWKPVQEAGAQALPIRKAWRRHTYGSPPAKAEQQASVDWPAVSVHLPAPSLSSPESEPDAEVDAVLAQAAEQLQDAARRIRRLERELEAMKQVNDVLDKQGATLALENRKLAARIEECSRVAAANLHDAENWREYKKVANARKRVIGLDAVRAAMGDLGKELSEERKQR